MKESCFFNFRLNMCFAKLSVLGKKCFLLEKKLFLPPSEFLLKKNCAAKISPEKELFLPLSESLLKKNHYQVRLADGSRVVVKLNTFHTVTH